MSAGIQSLGNALPPQINTKPLQTKILPPKSQEDACRPVRPRVAGRIEQHQVWASGHSGTQLPTMAVSRAIQGCYCVIAAYSDGRD